MLVGPEDLGDDARVDETQICQHDVAENMKNGSKKDEVPKPGLSGKYVKQDHADIDDSCSEEVLLGLGDDEPVLVAIDQTGHFGDVIDQMLLVDLLAFGHKVCRLFGTAHLLNHHYNNPVKMTENSKDQEAVVEAKQKYIRENVDPNLYEDFA